MNSTKLPNGDLYCITCTSHSNNIVWFQKLSIYLPHGRDFSLDSPTSLEIPVSKASYTDLNFWAFENPPPPRNFQSLLWGEYGYFLELHISRSIPLVMFGRFKHNLLLFPWRSSSKADDVYSAIIFFFFLTLDEQWSLSPFSWVLLSCQNS